jgi:subtilase family serine protease
MELKEMSVRKQRTRLNVECLETRNLLAAPYSPAQISHAYGFDQLSNLGTIIDGTGQTIAIVDANDDPRIFSDLQVFDQNFGLPDPPSFIKVDQYGGNSFSGNDSWSGETSLDVEWAHAMAPGANILLVEANSASFQDLYTAVDFARNAPGVVAVSMSFGAGESPSETSSDGLFTTPAGHIGGFGLPGGVTFLAASGDGGAPGLYPAYSPNVVAVGGTSLYLDNAGNYMGESAWSGSGGGISSVEPEPWYQYGVNATGARALPDVAYDADPNTGFWVYNTENGGGWGAIGGTSAAAPQWAAIVALADQARAQVYGVGSLDGPTQTLPALYSPQMYANDFYQIVSGNNGGFSAGYGYNLVTGLGTPRVPFVVSDLASASITFAAVSRGATHSSFAKSTEGLTPSVALTRIHGSEALLHATDKLQTTVDALFAEPSMSSTMTKADPLPLETAWVERGAIHPVQRTSEAHSNHARAEQAFQLAVGGLPGQEASMDASVAMAVQSTSPSKPA